MSYRPSPYRPFEEPSSRRPNDRDTFSRSYRQPPSEPYATRNSRDRDRVSYTDWNNPPAQNLRYERGYGGSEGSVGNGSRGSYRSSEDARYNNGRFEDRRGGYGESSREQYNSGYGNDSHQPDYQPQSYVPAHIRDQLPPMRFGLLPVPSTVPVPLGQTRQYSSQARSPNPLRHRDATPPPPPLQLPPDEYLELSRPSQSLRYNDVIPKLLVLDLNGALVYRNRSSDGRKSHPRPYLQSFLEYLFLPDPGSNPRMPRPWEVFVWSSAQPHNVRGMVEGAFGPRWIEGIWEGETERGKLAKKDGEGRLLGVWARDKMGLGAADYGRRVQTTKDLRKVLDHLRQAEPGDRFIANFDERTVVLLDDSPLKAIYQPFNQLVIPEYDKKEFQDAKNAAAALLEAGSADQSSAEGMDETLLAVIGVLDALRKIKNVPAWVRTGGLNLSYNTEEELTLESLPSHPDFDHWYKDRATLRHWIEMGKQALQRKEIEIRHGVEPDSPSTASNIKSPAYSKRTHMRWSPSSPRKSRSPSSPSRRDYSTSMTTMVGTDELEEDEAKGRTSTPNSSATEVRPIDVARYIDEIINRTSTLTIDQREQLESARSILSDLPTDPLLTTNGSKGNRPEVEKYSVQGSKKQEMEQSGEPSNLSSASTITSTSKLGKKARFNAEFRAAKESRPELTKTAYRAHIKGERAKKELEMKAIKKINLQRDLEDYKARKATLRSRAAKETTPSETVEEEEEEEEDWFEVIESPGEDNQSKGRSRSIGSQQSTSTIGKGRGLSSKKIRSDSWSGE